MFAAAVLEMRYAVAAEGIVVYVVCAFLIVVLMAVVHSQSPDWEAEVGNGMFQSLFLNAHRPQRLAHRFAGNLESG